MIELNCIFLLVGTICVLGYYYCKRKYSYFAERGVLHQKPVFPFGNIKGLGTKYTEGDLLRRCYNEFKGKDEIAGLFYFNRPVVIPLNLDLLRNIFIKDFQYFQDRGIYHNLESDPLSAHLFSVEGTYWKTLRMKLSPTFTSGKMKMMYSTFLMVADQFKEFLTPIAEKKSEIEIKEIMAQFSTDIIVNTAFGIECNSLTQPENEFRKIGRKIVDLSPVLLVKALFALSYPNIAKKLKITITDPKVTDFFLNLTKETTEYREKNNVHRNDFMSLLLQLKNNGKIEGDSTELGTITTEEMAAQMFLFFVGGFESSSSTMTFALYELALNPAIQTRVRGEVRQVLKDNNGVLDYKAVMSLTYLDQVIKETLRKYPVIDNLIRIANKDYLVPNTKHVIEKGTALRIPVLAIHRDPEIYPNPKTFDPERFTPENIAARHPFAWLPFGEGPRNCVGLRFGMMQVRVGLATILNNFVVSPTTKTPVPMVFKPNGGILTAKGGMYLRIETAA